MNETKPPANESRESSAITRSKGVAGRRLPLWKKLAFLTVIFILFVALAELLLIVAGISYPLLYQPDEYCATRLKNNLNVRYHEEGNAIVRTNSAGFRDIDRNRQKSKGVYRIAVVGDSFCEAIQVPFEKTFCFQLEQNLKKEGLEVEVLNFGISGFGTAQEFELLRHYVLDYQPDLIVLGMFLGNDIGDNSRSINPGQVKPYYDLVDGKLQLDDSFRSSPQFISAQSTWTQFKSGLINSSRTLQFGNKLYSRWKNRGKRQANVGIGLDPKLYRPPESDDWKEAWQVTEALIEAFYKKCKESDAECLVVTLSNPIQVHPDEQLRKEFQEENEIESLFYPDERVAKFCLAKKIPLRQLAKDLYLEANQKGKLTYFHGFENTRLGTGHWNETGHQRVAEILSGHLIQTTFSN